jgi:predicted acetyltransferase
MLKLIEANSADLKKEYLFSKFIPENENGYTNDWYDINEKDFEMIALKGMIDSSNGKNLPDGYVPETYFFLWDDDEIVGQFRFRHYLSDSLINGSGHIGYFIAKQFRGKGYGTAGLKLLLDKVKSNIVEDEYYLRVEKNNLPSMKVIKNNNGYIHHQDDEYVFLE